MWKQYAMAVLALGLWACAPEEMAESRDGAQSTEVLSQRAALTATASYDTTLKVPRCIGVASGCDTSSLVNGRGQVGPELNAPNTLGGTCPDGNVGTYRSDESVERVKVYTTDGSNLAPGKQVTVEVDVWAYFSSGTGRPPSAPRRCGWWGSTTWRPSPRAIRIPWH